jgi:hypothetical protein
MEWTNLARNGFQWQAAVSSETVGVVKDGTSRDD